MRPLKLTTSGIGSEEFERNPFGVEFDPDEVMERLERGEPEADIMKRGESAPRTIDSVPKF